MSADRRVCLLGFGEVGQILADDLNRNAGANTAAFDVLFDDASSAPRLEASHRPFLDVCSSASEAAEDSEVVISVVTASEAVSAAHSVAAALPRGAFYVDMNSVSPGTSQRMAETIESTGGRFVEAAIMSPIAPRRIASPILLGGKHSREFLDIADRLGFTGAEVFSDEVGPASAAKMARSVIVKGVEALLTESLTTARHFGVEAKVLESLQDLLPAEDWEARALYMIQRSIQHGQRRAEEMEEAARTVREAGQQPWMSEASAEREGWAGSHPDSASADLFEILDDLLRPNRKHLAGGSEGALDG